MTPGAPPRPTSIARPASRLEALRSAMRDAGLAALLVTRMVNVRYLSGFTGSAGMLALRLDAARLVTDGRYRTQAGSQLVESGSDALVELDVRSTAADAEAAVSAFFGDFEVALEDHSVTWAQLRRLEASFATPPVAGGRLVEDLRRVKDEAEIDRIAAACAIGDAAFARVVGSLAEGVTERDVALALETEMRALGASGNSFDPIVASGPNGAMPHARPTERPIQPGELVVMDFGCIYDGYCSDMTRTVSVGSPPSDAVELWELVERAQRAGVSSVGPGVSCAEVDAACRSIIVEAGHGDLFSHSTGHGVGLEIHEDPRVSATGGATLRAGDIVTVEPGVYLPGVGGVRLEDTLVVTADGAAALTHTPKQMVL